MEGEGFDERCEPPQFLVGFGGGVHEARSVASNAISFHVDSDGTPVLDE
jgi:hypothetical protein